MKCRFGFRLVTEGQLCQNLPRRAARKKSRVCAQTELLPALCSLELSSATQHRRKHRKITSIGAVATSSTHSRVLNDTASSIAKTLPFRRADPQTTPKCLVDSKFPSTPPHPRRPIEARAAAAAEPTAATMSSHSATTPPPPPLGPRPRPQAASPLRELRRLRSSAAP